MKITKGFQNMGTDVKLLFKQLVSYSALRAFPHFPHRPLIVAVTSGNRLLFHALAVGAFIPAPLRSGTTFVPHSEPLRYILPTFKHPPQHRAALVAPFSHSIYYVLSVPTHAISHPLPAVAFVPAASKPRKNLIQ